MTSHPASLKICQLSSVHPPDDIRIFHKMSATLAAAGYTVTFIVPSASRDTSWNKGVKIVGLKPIQGRLRRMLLMPIRVLIAALWEQADAYQFHDPELIPVGWILKLFGYKVIYDVHEDVPAQILTKDYIPRPLRQLVSKIAFWVESFSARVFTHIITATPAIARKFPTAKTTVVQNFPILNELTLAASPPYTQRPKNIIYVGSISRIRGILEMVNAMSMVNAQHHAVLTLGGKFGTESLRREAASQPGWERVKFRGQMSRQEVAQSMAEARAGLVLFHSSPNHDEAQPNKLFEYMSAGIPLIASDFPLWRQLIDSVQCGILVDPKNPKAIAQAINWILEHEEEAAAMGQRGKHATETIYNWANESKTLLNLYSQIRRLP